MLDQNDIQTIAGIFKVQAKEITSILNTRIDSVQTESRTAIEELAVMIKAGFDQTASKQDIERLDGRMNSIEVRMVTLDDRMDSFGGRMDRLENSLSQLTTEVKEFVAHARKFDTEYVELKVKYDKLEERVKRLELTGATA